MHDDNTPTQKQMMDRPEFAVVVFNDLKSSEKDALEVSANYGRWLLNSLFLMHGGALFGMFTFLGPVAREPEKIALYAGTIWWFVLGLLCAMLSGFFAWLNWSYLADDYDHMADYRMLWDAQAWVRKPKHTLAMPITNYSSILFGFLSGLCIVGAADAVVNQIGLGKWTEVLIA